MSAPTIGESGGFAFPYAFQHEAHMGTAGSGFSPGMTLRDYFAGRAITGIMAAEKEFTPDASPEEPKVTFRRLALCAYMQADAMLAARKEAL